MLPTSSKLAEKIQKLSIGEAQKAAAISRVDNLKRKLGSGADSTTAGLWKAELTNDVIANSDTRSRILGPLIASAATSAAQITPTEGRPMTFSGYGTYKGL